MIFGNIKIFAIECQLNPDDGGEWLFGKLCYWIDGTRVGDYELGTSLRDVLFQMKYIVHYRGRRSGRGLCHLDRKECFDIIDSILYGDDNHIGSIDIPDEVLKFNAKIPVDVFDDWKIFCIECEENLTILYKKNNSKNIKERKLSPNEFDDPITSLYLYLNKKYEEKVELAR